MQSHFFADSSLVCFRIESESANQEAALSQAVELPWDDEANNENDPPTMTYSNRVISPMVRTKKKRKQSFDDDYVDSPSPEPKKKRKCKAASSTQESNPAKRGGSSVYTGVSFNKKESKYLSYITLDKMRALGSYKLESDAALVSDLVYAEFKGRRNNFESVETYSEARTVELLKTGLSVGDVGTVESIREKAAAKIVKIRRDKRL
jgi:hypothetical protein